MTLGNFTIPTREWGGAAGRTLVQGIDRHAESKIWIARQADDVAGQVEQNLVFRCHRDNGDYIGAITAYKAGHGSSAGLQSMSATRCRLWFGHQQLNTSGYVTYDVGQRGTATFTRVNLPRGDISIDQPANRLCLRNGNRYRVYDFASVESGEPILLADFTIPAWGKRFQGHLIAGGRLFVHRDVATKAESRAHCFDLSGNPVTVRTDNAGKSCNWIETTRMGDEAEGFVIINSDEGTIVFVVKRTGGNNANRIIQCTRWLVVNPKGGSSMAEYTLWRGVRVKPEQVASLDMVAKLCGPNIYLRPTQGGYNRGGVAASAGTHDGSGAVDFSVAGLTQAQIDFVVRLLRENGWGATWFRPYLKGVWPSHIHATAIADPTRSQGAKDQEARPVKSPTQGVRAGRNGLANNGKDTGPVVYGINGEKFPSWGQSIHNPANKKKTLDDYLAELGPVKDVSADAINKSRGSGKPSRHTAQMQSWLNLWRAANQPAIKPLDIDGIWSAKGPTQDLLDDFREKGLGWTGNDIGGPVGAHSLNRLHDDPAVAASNPLPVREPWPAKK